MLNLYRKHLYPPSRKLTLQLFGILFSLSISACSHVHHSDQHSAQQDERHTHPKLSHGKEAEFQLTLNDQEKWLLDSHTRSVLKTMSNRLMQAKLPEQTAPERIILAEKLELDLDKLIQGCTMQGGDHDALHTYLNELIPALSRLKASGELVHAERVQHLLEIYPAYFD